jgi:hypothetical protein
MYKIYISVRNSGYGLVNSQNLICYLWMDGWMDRWIDFLIISFVCINILIYSLI